MKNSDVSDVEFYCSDNLSEYSDSLLFDSDEDIAGLKLYDSDGGYANVRLTVKGDKEVWLLDKDGNVHDGVTYSKASKYPAELREAIKNGKEGEDYGYSDNNWFEYIYEIRDKNDNIIHNDDVVFDWNSTTDFTPEKLKADMLRFAESLFGSYRLTRKSEQINAEKVMDKIKDFKKEMEGISASKVQANKEKEKLVNDIFNNKIPEDIKEIYPVIDALAVEIGYDAVILRLGVNHYPYYWGLDFKQKDEIIGSEGSNGTLLVVLPTDAADINSSTAIYADKTTVAISDKLKTENVAMKWQNAKEDILTIVATTINKVLSNEKTTLGKMKKENQQLKENVLKDTIERD